MGYAPYYQAIPEKSELFHQLQTDHLLAQLLVVFFTLGSRPFDLFETGRKEVEDVLSYQPIFRSQEEADRAFKRLLIAIDQANSLSPGLIERRSYLEQTKHEIEESLVRELERKGVADPRTILQTCIRGELAFAGEFRLVPAPLVTIAASLFRDIEPDMLFDKVGEDYLYDDYRDWRDMYLQAADRGEAILIF